MIKFFRHNRQRLLSESKFSKYLLYAIGEVVLVVIGILLALQVNNSNEIRKKKANEIQLFKSTLQDLEQSSKTNDTQIEWFMSFQDLHYDIYRQTKGEIAIDTAREYNYNDLLWSNIFRPLIQENYAAKVESMSNERIKNLFRDHIWREKLTMEAMNEWNDHKFGELRPYFNENGVTDTDIIFNDKPYEFMSLAQISMIEEDKLRELYGTEEFDQLLFNLRYKASWVIHCLDNLQKANHKLDSALEAFIDQDFDTLDTIEPLKSYY